MLRSVTAAIILLGCVAPTASAYVEAPLPLGAVVQQSVIVCAMVVTKVDKAGNLIIFLKQGSGITPLYVLKSSVKIPPRLGLSDTLETGVPYFVEKACDAIVRSLMAAGSP